MATKTIEKNKIKQKGVNSFINELKAEVKKVEWPEKKSVVSSSIIIMVIMMFFVGASDDSRESVERDEFNEAISAIINFQNFDNQLLKMHQEKTNERFDKIVSYVNEKNGDDLTITKEFIDMRHELD